MKKITLFGIFMITLFLLITPTISSINKMNMKDILQNSMMGKFDIYASLIPIDGVEAQAPVLIRTDYELRWSLLFIVDLSFKSSASYTKSSPDEVKRCKGVLITIVLAEDSNREPVLRASGQAVILGLVKIPKPGTRNLYGEKAVI